MSLPAPNLDDRRFQDLVDDAKRLVQQRCPEWTDHNVSDPGVTLIEAFATMVDQLLYRLNQVPDRHYVKFLELIGVRLFPPTAAQAPVTFRLSAPQADTVRIPAGTQVATLRTEAEEAITFTTVSELEVVPARVAQLAAEPAAGGVILHDETVKGESGFHCFDRHPRSPATPCSSGCPSPCHRAWSCSASSAGSRASASTRAIRQSSGRRGTAKCGRRARSRRTAPAGSTRTGMSSSTSPPGTSPPSWEADGPAGCVAGSCRTGGGSRRTRTALDRPGDRPHHRGHDRGGPR